MKKETEEKTFAEILCELSLEIDIFENAQIENLHEFVYRQVDIVAVLSSFDAILKKQEWLTDGGDGYLPATSRKFTAAYARNIKISEIRHDSLFLSIFSGVASGLILMLIQETYKNTHPESSSPILQITNHYENCNISINGDQIKLLPEGSISRETIRIDQGSGLCTLDSKAFIEGIIGRVNPGDDLETNIRNCINVLKEENIITVGATYNSKGERTVIHYSGRMLDYRI